MNIDQQRFFKKAILNYGIRLLSGMYWFIDEGKIYYGEESNGEIRDYFSGYICRNIFVLDYSTREGNIDMFGWDTFIKNHLEMNYIDVRN